MPKLTLQNPSDPGYDLILCWGQSNMSGRGTPLDTARLDITDPRVFQYGAAGSGSSYASMISLATDPLLSPDNFAANNLGPSLHFARWYLTQLPPNRRVLLVPSSYGGTQLSTNGSPLGWRRGVTGNLYAQAIMQAQAALAAAGPRARIAAILWVQGESDGDANIAGSTYQTDLDALIDGARSDLGFPALPFLIGQMVPEYLTTGTRAAINAVHAATPTRKANTSFSYGLPGANQGDGNHINATGQRFAARSLFEQFLALAGRTAAPTVPGQVTGLTAGATTSTTQVLSWTGVSGALGYLIERRTTGGSTWTNLGVFGNTATVTGLTNGTSMDYRVTAYNSAGGGTPSSVITATVGSASDTTAPTVPTNLTVGTVTASSVALSWTASTDAVGVTGYRIYRGGTQVGTSSTTSYTDGGLSASTAYTYTVAAYDAAGNVSAQSSSVSATTSAASSDTTPPSTPTNLTAGTPTSSSVPLSWTASTDNVGVTGYRIYRGGTQIGTSSTASYTDTTVSASTTYSYTVAAVDAAGNVSTQSSSVSVTTPAASSGVNDTFTRSDSTTSLGTATSGQTWVVKSGTWGINTGRAYSATALDDDIALIQTGLTDQHVSAVVTPSPGTGLVARGDSASFANGYMLNASASAMAVFKKVSGAYSSIGSVGTGVAAGDTLELDVIGTTITVKKNGTTVTTITDSSVSTGTFAGMRQSGGGTAYWDNFTVS